MQGVSVVTYRACSACGKVFPMYDEHVYKDVYKGKARVFCSWSCFNKREIFEDGRKHRHKADEEVNGNSTKYGSPNVVCPFYKGEEKNKILCEGLFKNSKLQFTMSPQEKKVRYRRKYCEKSYERCPIAKMHFRIYNGEDGDDGKI